MMRTFFFLLFCFFLSLSSMHVSAQLDLNEYQDDINMYYSGVDTQYQLYNEVKTSQEEANIFLKLYPHSTSSFTNSYKNISTLDVVPHPDVDFTNYISWGGASNYYLAHSLNYTLNNDTSKVFYYKNNAISDTNTAILIIPGSGINQGTGVAIYNPTNYHNSVCTIASFSRQYGDVYTFCRPNDDFASIWTTVSPGNRRKLNYDALTSKSNLNGKNWAANCYIQINALTKHLKKKYKKVIVIGLSAGSWGAFFTSLQSEPDGAQIASGYSINFNDLTYYYSPNQLHFDGLFSAHPIDSIRKTLKNSPTQFLFSYGSGDVVQHMTTENTSHVTQNFFNTPDTLGNLSYFYDFSTHRFPCEALDTFFTRIKKMPKATLEFTNTCKSDSAVLKVIFTGIAPYTFNLYRDSSLVSSFTSNSDTFKTVLTQEGSYFINNIIDQNNTPGFKTKLIIYEKDPKLAVLSKQKRFDCGNDSAYVDFTLSGSSGFSLYYRNSTLNLSTSISDTIFSLNLPNEQYTYDSIIDQKGCLLKDFGKDTIEYYPLTINLSTPNYNCDSQKTQIHFDITGNAPYTIQYTHNGASMSYNTTQNSFDLLLNNGLYQFLSVIDATGCIVNINQAFSFFYTPVSFSASTPLYICDSNKTRIDFSLQGNPPFTINYSKDLMPSLISTSSILSSIMFTNGTYNFTSLIDATGCVDSINHDYNFNRDTIDIQLSTPIYNCDSNKTMTHFELQGNAPWTIQYTQNGTPLQIVTSNNSFDYFFGNGVYQFLSVSDSTLCVKNINQVFNFNYLPISISTSTPVYRCDSNKTQIDFTATGNPPFSIAYTKDNNPLNIVSNSSLTSAFFENGNYNFTTVTDATGCTANINVSHSFNFDTIDIQLSTPLYNCDSNKTKIHFELQGNAPWTIQYTQNGTPMQINTSISSFDYFFANGIYQFLSISDATLCVKNINQVFNFNYLPISISASTPVYRCDSNKTQIDFTATGNPPFSIAYTKDNNPLNIVSNSSLTSAFFENGNYNFTTVTDATGCTANINVSHSINFDTIDIQLSTPIYNCDSNKTMTHFELQGNAPWTIQYTQNGTPMQINTSNSSFDYFFTNGIYQFLSISDATLCVKNINQVFNFNYLPISISSSTPVYRCDSNKTQIIFSIQGNPPFSIDYTKDNSSANILSNFTFSSNFFENGNYNFINVTDATGCTSSLNQAYNFNYDTLEIQLGNPVYDCDSNKTKIHFELEGNAPWTIQYTQNSIPLQILTSNNSFDLYFTNGVYQFLLISDATQCVKNINQAFNFSYFPIGVNASNPLYICDSNKTQIDFNFQGNPPFSLAYTQNGSPLSFNTSNYLNSQWYINGSYNFTTLTDATGCVANLNQSHIFDFDTIDVALSTPAYNCDSNKTMIEFNLQGNAPWTIYYLYNGLNSQYITSQANSIGYFNNGNYLFTSVVDATNCVKQINESFSFNYQPISASIAQQIYDCDSNKYKVSINYSTGNFPWTVVYHQIGGGTYSKTFNSNYQSIWIENGDWIIDYITDATGCVKNLNTPITVNFDQIQATVTASNYDCDSNKTLIEFSLLGNAPWTIYYLNTLTNTNHTFVTSNSTVQLWLNNGNYIFNAVTDVTGCTKSIYHVATNLYTPLSFQRTGEQYHCDSNKIKIDYIVSGDPSWTLTYRNLNTNNTYQQVTSNINNSLFLPTGTWELVSITDAKCSIILHDTLYINFPQLNTSLSSAMINCDSAKMQTQLVITSGLSPYTLHYNYNGQNLQYATSQINQNIILPNGSYYFNKVTDSVGCEVHFAQAYTIDYTPLRYVSSQNDYNCSKDSTSVQFTFVGQNPVQLVYSLNNQNLDSLKISSNADYWFTNGNYQWAYLIDSLGCIDSIQENLSIDNVPVDFNIDSIRPNCTDKKHELRLNLEGKSPWILTYNRVNITDSLIFNQDSPLWSIEADNYYLLTLEDSNHCKIAINQNQALPSFLQFDPLLQTDYKQIYLQANDLVHTWYQNNSIIDSIHKTKIAVQGAGDYFVVLTDSTGCQYQSNTINLSFEELVTLYPNPAGNEVNVLVDDKFDGFWQYIITDAYGQKAKQETITEKFKTIDIQYLESGIYSLTVIYNNDAGLNKKVLRLLKR